MKYIATITDEDVRFEIEMAATELEEDHQIVFPDSDSRTEAEIAEKVAAL